MSRQSSPDQPVHNSSPPSSPGNGQGDSSEHPSSSLGRRMSKSDSDGYPSWLPSRPPPPAPASTYHSSVGAPEGLQVEPPPFVGGRKPTPRSVRIVSLQEQQQQANGEKAPQREVPDETRPGNAPRAWSRASGAALSPAMFAANSSGSRAPQPKFRSRSLHIELLRNPSQLFRLYFHLYPVFVFAHIPLQTFFDFNTVFILFQVSRYPNPQAPGVPGSGRNWLLGTAAYIACWLAWIIFVFLLYEVVYNFFRRWRVKRPLILPIYLSSSAFNFASMTSYSTFCFLQHLRISAFSGENGSIRDGLAETFWFYSQNLPTVALLMPRAGLALALLLGYTSPQASEIVLADAGIYQQRDGAFFHQDGTLTDYARGVLIANAAWTAWRILVLLISWVGLWVVSGQGCAGLCGPRYRWEEEEAEKRMSAYSEAGSEADVLPWSWRECTRIRVQETYDFCLTVKPPLQWNGKKQAPEQVKPAEEPFDGLEQVLAAVGFPSVPPPAKRGILSEDLFESPKDGLSPTDLSEVIPKVAQRSSKDKVAGPSAPLLSLPYPFTAPGAQMSSADKVPFPPSPSRSRSRKTTSAESSSSSGSGSSSTSSGSTEDDSDEDDEVSDAEDEDDEDGDVMSEQPSTGRASGSMSSLGHPVNSKYPFQFRRPGGRNSGVSSGGASHMSPSNPRSRLSQGTHSTGNRESSDSHSPRSLATSGGSDILSSSGIPMPPRHPQQGQGRNRGRQRAGTVPAAGTSSPSPVAFPTASRPRAQRRSDADSYGSPGIGSDEGHELLQDHVSENSHSDASSHAEEQDDVVGLLSPNTPSPKSSLFRRTSSLSQQMQGARAGSKSRTNSHSSSSRSRANSFQASVRSRAQSLIHSVGAASHSSLELVQSAIRSRADSSMARLEEVSTYSSSGTHSRSGSGSVPSINENNTFGVPIRRPWALPPFGAEDAVEEEPASLPQTPLPNQTFTASHSDISFDSPSTMLPPSKSSSEADFSLAVATAAPTSPRATSPVDIPRSPNFGHNRLDVPGGSGFSGSPAGIGTAAAQSFVTVPATIAESTESGGGGSWGDLTNLVNRADGTWRPAPSL